jgi:hypothetical protein
MKLQSCLILALVSTAPSLSSAQGLAAGRATFQMTVHIPDSVKSPLPIAGDFSAQIDMMTDGRNVAVEVVPDASQPMMAGMHIRVIFALGGDTAHVGVILPPQMAAMAGGGSGIRMDVPVAMMGADNPLFGAMMDSISKTMTDSLPVYRKLGTTATVAGIRCEEWESVFRNDTIHTCVIATPPALLALQSRVRQMSGIGSLLAQVPGMADLERKAYNGEHVVPIRTTNAHSGMHMELTGFTPGAPDAAMFQLPADLQLMPMPALPGKPAGGGGPH